MQFLFCQQIIQFLVLCCKLLFYVAGLRICLFCLEANLCTEISLVFLFVILVLFSGCPLHFVISYFVSWLSFFNINKKFTILHCIFRKLGEKRSHSTNAWCFAQTIERLNYKINLDIILNWSCRGLILVWYVQIYKVGHWFALIVEM